jgi:peroxiredoxin
VRVRLWIDKSDFLIRQVAYELDLARMSGGLPAEMRRSMEGMRMAIAERHVAIETDPVFPEGGFTFVPPEGATLVERFGPLERSVSVPDLVGRPAPDFALDDVEGKEVKRADFEGRILLLTFWATWCSPCRMEIPTFVALQSQYSEQGFSVIGISTDSAVETVRAFAPEHQINYPLLMADGRVQQDYGNIAAIPTTFAIDRQGIIRQVYVGTPEDMLVFQRDLEALLAE